MKKIINGFFLLTFIFLLTGCSKEKKDDFEIKNEATKEIFDPNCVEFVALWSSGEIAKKIGKDKKWVFLNYTVELWDTPPLEGKGGSVGKLRASSYARIIEKRGGDYKVESPINQAHGWINEEHVKTISKKNPKTKALCE